MAIGQELLNVPMGDMIRQMAFAIADAQFELDESSMRVAEMMSGQYPLRDEEGRLVDKDGAPVADEKGALKKAPEFIDSRVYFGTQKNANGQPEAQRLSMMELGFTPTFYQFIDTLIEVKIAIKITREVERTQKVQDKDTSLRTASRKRSGLFSSRQSTRLNVSTTTVDASYSAKYSYSAEGASLLRTKLVPVPPPPILEERIRRLMDEQAEAQKQAEPAKNG